MSEQPESPFEMGARVNTFDTSEHFIDVGVIDGIHYDAEEDVWSYDVRTENFGRVRLTEMELTDA